MPANDDMTAMTLDEARARWHAADWISLAGLARVDLSARPERAMLALLAATGCLQQGDWPNAEALLHRAMDWGCDRRLMHRLTLAGLHDSLGRASALAGSDDQGLAHFLTATAFVDMGGDVLAAGRARMSAQLDRIGFVRDGQDGWKLRRQVIERLKANDSPGTDIAQTKSRFSPSGYEFYLRVSKACQEKNRPPFILLDSKSLPRSGLHNLKNTLAKILGAGFSFCEWYQEPGCCKKMPCTLTAYASAGRKRDAAMVRLVKSHDLQLDDPVYESLYSLRRVVLVREPLFLLTSWFALDQLSHYKPALLKAGIRMEKVWMSHEPIVLDSAYRTMDASYVDPEPGALAAWLEEKTRYVEGFLEKWVRPALADPQPFTTVVDYGQVNSYIAGLLAEMHGRLPDETKARADAYTQNVLADFHAKADPYKVASVKLTQFITEHAALFRMADEAIKSSYPDVYSVCGGSK